jgi:hypothetical protein
MRGKFPHGGGGRGVFVLICLFLLKFIYKLTFLSVQLKIGEHPNILFYLLCEPIYVSLRLFHCTLYKQLVFVHNLMRKGLVGRLCHLYVELWNLKYFSCGTGMVHQGISCRVLRVATYDPGMPGH